MKGFFGPLFLIAGTIAASLAAASGEKPWVAVPLDAVELGDPEITLFDDLTAGADGEAAATVVPAGTPVSAGVIAGLRAQGAQTVRVRRLAVEQERVDATALESIEGRVLAEILYFDDATGARVERDEAAERLARADELTAFADKFEADGGELPDGAVVVELPVRPTDEGDGAAPAAVDDSDTDAAAEAAATDELAVVTTGSVPEGARVVGTAAELAAVRSSALLVGVPTMRRLAPAGRFIDADLAARIVEQGYPAIDVRVPKPAWNFDDWSGRWVFLGGLLVMIVGVVLMRSARTEAALAATRAQADADELTPTEHLAQLVQRARALSASAATLSRDDLLTGCDDLINGPVFAIGAGADQLRAALGGRNYAQVMAAFSTGERRLSRAWSAAADGYREEAVASLAECVEPFENALDALGGKPAVERTDEGAEYVVWESGGREN